MWERSRALLALCLEPGHLLPLAGRVEWRPDRADEVASRTSPSFHAIWWVAPPSAAASRRCARCCGVTGGRSHESQSIDWWNALDHTNTCAHVNLELKFG